MTQTKEPVPAAAIAVSVPDGADDVRPDTPVTVVSTRGTLSDIEVTSADGTVLDGELSDDKTSWVSNATLALETGYTVSGSAENAEGEKTTLASGFTTLTPRDTEAAAITPTKSMETVGVGMPIVVLFDSAPVDKAAVERRLTVNTSVPVEGSWRWMSAKQVAWRPAEYWPSGTKVDVTADMTGLEFANNVWGSNTDPVHFEIGRNQVSVVDITGYDMVVRRDGEVIKEIPVSNGMGVTGKYATRNGTKVIITRENSHRMVAPGQQEDDPGYYDQVVKYAMRLTWSGEFIHAAPWSVSAQGRRNVSHGCTNVSTSNAKWLMDNSLIGDPVEYINGKRQMTIDNGWGFWNVSYDEWKTGSALYEAPAPEEAPAADEAATAAQGVSAAAGN
ncbi:MAG: Ig-like domain-containing protein [Actinomycetales bacterium]